MKSDGFAFSSSSIPDWALVRTKPVLQHVYDFVGAPLRMVLLPDRTSEKLHLTSLRAERMASVLPHLRGRVLDVGAGDNTLLKLYLQRAANGHADPEGARRSVGVEVEDWGGGCTLIEDAASLPFPDESFDTVSFVACINHITNRDAAMVEARRVLKPGGNVLVTMIGRLIGNFGHAVWWYSEDKYREVHKDELMGMDPREVTAVLTGAGLCDIRTFPFVYGLNTLYSATK